MPPPMGNPVRRAFSLVEVLVSIAVVAILMAFLLPALSGARAASYTVVCANNLRQIGIAWQGYLGEHRERFPQHTEKPDWNYGGVTFASRNAPPVLDMARPINPYLVMDDRNIGGSERAAMFHCPSDTGVFRRDDGAGVTSRTRASVLAQGSCFREYGTSYRANLMLLDSTAAGIDTLSRPLSLAELHVDHSRLLLTGDAAWYYATRPRYGAGTATGTSGDLDASWHRALDRGNMLAVDGSVRFLDFREPAGVSFSLSPRPR